MAIEKTYHQVLGIIPDAEDIVLGVGSTEEFVWSKMWGKMLPNLNIGFARR